MTQIARGISGVLVAGMLSAVVNARDSANTAALILTPQLSAQGSSTVVRPPARSGFGLAFDTRRSRLVLFGGSDSAFQRLGDTWEWSGGSWTRIEVSGPPARSDFAMTFDARRGRVVVFGGRTATGLGRDTWEFDGARWALVDSTGPTPRALTNMTYDDARGRVVLFGGSTGSAPLNDTWEWDGTSWTRAADGPEILHTAATFDAASNGVFVFGGFFQDARSAQLWARTDSGWTTLSPSGPPARAEHRGVYAPSLGFVIFGGIGGQGMSVAERGRAKLNDLWAFDGVRWTRLDP